MKNFMKKSIFLGVFVFGLLGLFSQAHAEIADYYFQGAPSAYSSYNYNSYGYNQNDNSFLSPYYPYAYQNQNYGVNTAYNYNTYSNQGYYGYTDSYYGNGYTNAGYNNTGYNQAQNSPTQVVYASDTNTSTPSIYVPQIKSNTSTSSSTKSSTSTKSSNSSNVNTTNNSSSATNISTQEGVANVSGEGVGIESRNGLVALSAYGTDRFLPDTILEWILVFFLILIIIILLRLVTKKRHHHA